MTTQQAFGGVRSSGADREHRVNAKKKTHNILPLSSNYRSPNGLGPIGTSWD